MIFKFLNFYLIFLLYSGAQAQVDYTFDPLSITASRLDDGFVSETRDIIVLDRQQIAAIPGESVSEILQYLGSVDIRRRGINGIQADYGLRGCSFEQVLVLIDGVRVNDPQTGHHNNDLPVSLSEIEKIEILLGHGSSLYGSNGVGGVIHVITQSPEKTRTRLKLNGGSFKTISGEISQSFNFIGFKNRIHLEKQKSDGYMRNMNYDVTTLSCQVQKKFKNVNIRGRWGSIEKAFGANRFYAD